MPAVPLLEAAHELGMTRRQLRRVIESGAPVARRGGKGRGNLTLVDPRAIQAFQRSRDGKDCLVVLAAQIPELLADAAYQAFTRTEGPHKHAVAGALAGAWYLSVTALLDHVRDSVPEIRELRTAPEKIDRLRAIFERSC